MAKKTIYVFLTLIIALVSKNTLAADGYENFDFGMSIKVIEYQLPLRRMDMSGRRHCDFEEIETGIPGTREFKSNKLSVNGKDHAVSFGFKNDKLYLVTIDIPLSNHKEITKISSQLTRTYGQPLIVPIEHRSVFLFDNSTIALVFDTKANKALIIYSAESFM